MTNAPDQTGYVVASPSVALARVEASVQALTVGIETLRRDMRGAVAVCERRVSAAIRRGMMRLRFAAAEAEADGAAIELDSDLVADFVGECIAEDQAETDKPAESPADE